MSRLFVHKLWNKFLFVTRQGKLDKMCLSFAWTSLGHPGGSKCFPPDVLVVNVTPTLKFGHTLREGVGKEKMENLITRVTPVVNVWFWIRRICQDKRGAKIKRQYYIKIIFPCQFGRHAEMCPTPESYHHPPPTTNSSRKQRRHACDLGESAVLNDARRRSSMDEQNTKDAS